MLDHLLRVAAVLHQLDKLAQVVHRVASAVGAGRLGVEAVGLALVAPVGRDPLLRNPIHRLGADLQLDAQAPRPDHGGVQRAVVVALGRGDVVLEPLGHAGPGLVDQAERPVAVVLLVHDHAEGVDVGQLGEGDRLPLQLAPDRVGRLLAAVHAGGDARCVQPGGDLARHHGHRRPLLDAQGVQPALDGVAGRRVQVPEAELLQLGADAVHADGAGERRVDVERLARDPLPLLGLGDVVQRAHVVQPVGQLDHQHAHVLGDGQDEAAQVLRLAGVLAVHLQAGELGDALHQLRHLFAEPIGDVRPRGDGVLDDVVQQRGDDGGGVEAVVGEDARHLDRVGEVGIAGGAQLAPVHAHGIDVGAVQQRLVGGRVIGLDPVDQLILAQEALVARRGRVGAGRGRL